ncbi:ATP-binding protein [Halalkalibacter krulwichiae]|uniref:Acylphosphatase n=1 Tax=Halalkalibacter krulwichiae TaxID=199441 RepID=A0A1X9MM96_9BACI|nr:acylphosphatase [Halalkalibacter krulwichiae]ARK32222.1 Cyanophycin synthetase [Halalkalibacter krulwichiae]
MNQSNWLPQLKSLVPKDAYGFTSVMYTIALEAWKRGLTVKFYKTYSKGKVRIRYAISSEGTEQTFQYSLADSIPKEARKITKNKETTKEYLLKANVPTPKGRSFGPESDIPEMVEFSKTLTYPLVIKPTSSSLGKGVTTGIMTEEELSTHLTYLRKDKGYENIIVEEEATGEDTRVFVVGYQVVSAYKRIPANVTGDGKHSIAELIEVKNNARLENPHASDYQIKINDDITTFLSKSNYSLDSVPAEGERVFLSDSTLHSLAAETVDVTDQLTEESKQVAVNAAKALPGLSCCGIDIMIDNERGTNYVLELNSRPNIGGGLFPVHGMQRDIPKALIDYFFPETASHEHSKESHQFYYDYKRIADTLYTGIAEEIILPAIPKQQPVCKKIVIARKVSSNILSNKIYKKAIGLKINGYVRTLKNKNLLIVAAGDQDKIEMFLEALPELSSKQLDMKVEEWEKPVMIGFRVKSSNSRKTTKSTVQPIPLETELIQQRDQAIDQLKRIEESKSWKYTMPIRKLVKKVRGKAN